jgi:hypothetical protein
MGTWRTPNQQNAHSVDLNRQGAKDAKDFRFFLAPLAPWRLLSSFYQALLVASFGSTRLMSLIASKSLSTEMSV